eukprot:jgi/Bigna1/54569/estExt_Genewise1Plus.C_370116
MASKKIKIEEILPKAGLVYSEKANLSEVLCKPKIMPIKSMTLAKIEKMQKDAANPVKADEEDTKRADIKSYRDD